MAFVPKTPKPPSGGSSLSKRLEQMKQEMEAKRGGRTAVAEASAAGESAGPQPGEAYTLQKGDTLESIAQRVDQQPDAIWNHDENEELRQQRGAPDKLQAGDTVFIPEEETGTGPVGQGDYVVKDGDCVSSIAKETGHFWVTIWEDPDNSELREARRNPNILLPGDRVTIPQIATKEESGETEMRHRFVRRGEPSAIHLQVLRYGEPCGNTPYTLEIDGEEYPSGTTDASGSITVSIPGNAQKAKLVVSPSDDPMEYHLKLGGVDPVSGLRGVQQRLRNLGFLQQTAHGCPNQETTAALRLFQNKHGLADTGEPDDATRAKLLQVHQS